MGTIDIMEIMADKVKKHLVVFIFGFKTCEYIGTV